MISFLTSPIVLLTGAILALAGLIVSIRLLPLSSLGPSVSGPWRGILYRVLVIGAIAGGGAALPLLGVAWERLFGAPPKVHVWGLLALGGVQIAIGILLLVLGRPDEGLVPAASRLFRRWGLPALVLIAGLSWVLLGLGALVSRPASDAGREPSPLADDQPGMDQDDGLETVIGVVRGGEFYVLTPGESAGLPARLTGIAMQESVSPETKEIDLSAYEGSAILVHGHDGGGWIYEATVIDQGGPLLTEIAEQVFR